MPKKRRARSRSLTPAARTGPRVSGTKQPVARMVTPGQLAAAVPLLLGFLPTESLVVLCGHEPRGRIGLSFRLDLPSPDHVGAAAAVADLVESHVRHDGATRFSLLLFSDEPGHLPRAALVDVVRERFPDLREMEVLHVRDGRWWSYACSRPCCPAEGTPVSEDQDSPPVTLLAAEKVLRGEVVAGSREQLAATLAGPTFLEAQVAGQRCRDAAALVGELFAVNGPATTHRILAELWDEAVARFAAPPADLDRHEAALLAMSLTAGAVRDHLTSVPEDERPAALAVLAELMRRTPAPMDAAVCAAYGWLTYLQGGGALASIAAERALASDPTHSLVRLLDEALTRVVPPHVLRDLIDRNRARLTA